MGRQQELWVFGYGSLMWDPGFEYIESHQAKVHGYHRALCVYSHIYRGTPERPGLIVGLDRGGSCRGMAFRVASDRAAAVEAYLHEREMVTHVYRPRRLPVRLSLGTVQALTYVADRHHPQFAGRLTQEEAMVLVRQGHGRRGSCIDYLRNTVRHLEELGIDEGWLHRLLWAIEAKKDVPASRPRTERGRLT